MTFLPIVERELRVAARRSATHWTRFCAALATLTLWLLLALSTPQWVPVPQLSKNLFIATGLLAFGFCALAGVFLTADCLSVEKREGTLGLLFLTDLKSHLLGFGLDLVLGLRAKRRLQRRFREIASGPLSKEVKAQRADATAALGFGHRPLNSAQP